MQNFIIYFINNFGYLGITLLIALENVFPPIPSEVILGFGGFITSVANLSVLGVIVFSSIGSIIGALILYYIGYFFNKEKLIKIVNGRIGKYLFLKEKDIDESDKWFSNKGGKAVFIGRFIPIIRSLISLPAGMNKMNLGKFLFFTLIGSLIWNSILVLMGRILGNKWDLISIIIDKYCFLLVLFILIFISLRIWKSKGKV